MAEGSPLGMSAFAASRLPVPDELRTTRLLLRRWRPADALQLEPILAENFNRLGPWIPRRVAEPAPVERLAQRLTEFSAAFDAGREWRYGVFALDTSRIVGELDLFPRDGSGRVAFENADHIEIGYWLRAEATGQGHATEAARAALDVALTLPGISRVAIHCDERNASSAAVPRRLGFQLAARVTELAMTPGDADVRLQIWEYARP